MVIAKPALAALSLIASALPCLASGPLAAEAIQARLVGRQIAWWDKGTSLAGALYLAPDGRAEIVLDLGVETTDTGTWRIVGTQLCTRWAKARGGLEKCYSVEEVGPDSFDTSGGNRLEIREPQA